jgi:hypothetical protein
MPSSLPSSNGSSDTDHPAGMSVGVTLAKSPA